jgi:hypothetical protein
VPFPQLPGSLYIPLYTYFSNKDPYYPHKPLFLSVFSLKRRDEFSVSHCGTENIQRDFKKYLLGASINSAGKSN